MKLYIEDNYFYPWKVYICISIMVIVSILLIFIENTVDYKSGISLKGKRVLPENRVQKSGPNKSLIRRSC